MNILLVSYYFDQPGCGGKVRPRALARHFRDAGQRVISVTADHGGSRPGEDRIALPDPSRNCERAGANYPRWLWRRLAVEALLRCGRYASILGAWQRRVLRAATEILAAAQPDVVLATYPPVESLLLGLELSRLGRVPLVADFRDGLLFEPVDRRALGFAAVRRHARHIEERLAAEAAAVVTVSPAISRYFEQELGCRLVATIPNGFDADAPASPLEPSPFAPGRFHAVHTGSLSLSDPGCDLAPFVRGVEKAVAADPELGARLMLHFAGRLSGRERRLLRPLESSGIARVHGFLSRPQALWLQRHADLLLLLASPDRSSVATTKLFEYMQAARPVLALADGTRAAEVMKETGIGWIVAADSPVEIASALARAAKDRAGRPARDEAAIRGYGWMSLSGTYLSLLKRVAR